MPSYTQANQPLEVQTPLGKDALLLVGFHGREAISELFQFDLEMITPKETPASFDKIIGQSVTVRATLMDNSKRYFNGIVRRFTEGGRDTTFLHYRAEVAPQFWFASKRVNTRTFQQMTVPDILKQVLQGLDVRFSLQATYYPRDYCLQYDESDFNFACRLMEDEGIFYFFQHDQGKHTLVLGDCPGAHPQAPQQSRAIYDDPEGGVRPNLRVSTWLRSQELRSGKYTLWDYNFALPNNNLQAQQTIIDQVQAGKITHKFRLAGNDKLEVYNYPGGYAQRFDGVDKGGGDDSASLQKVFVDNQRTVRVRMEQEASPGLVAEGTGNIGHFLPGHRFTLERHFDADGEYVLTEVRHSMSLGDAYRTGEVASVAYQNGFACIPVALPYRPPRVTPKPVIQGPRTAVVVGPPGEDVFCDKYGRVKVQFHWDRLGKKNADSSCWVRVAHASAGPGFGAVTLPRIGHEVVVAFLDGDPDRPLIVGGVYNAANMPPYPLPDHRTISGLVYRSHRGGVKNANELRFQNALGGEQMVMHAETDYAHQSENNHHVQVGKVHKHEVGQLHHMIVGPPPDLTQYAIAGPGGGGGSGAGGDGAEGALGKLLEVFKGPAEEWAHETKKTFVNLGKHDTIAPLEIKNVLGFRIETMHGWTLEHHWGPVTKLGEKDADLKAKQNVNIEAGLGISQVAENGPIKVNAKGDKMELRSVESLALVAGIDAPAKIEMSENGISQVAENGPIKVNAKGDKMELRSADSITLVAGLGAAKIEMSDGGITLSVGPTTKIVLSESGITLSTAAAKITMSEADITCDPLLKFT